MQTQVNTESLLTSKDFELGVEPKGVVYKIPVKLIRPYRGQPRQQDSEAFSEESLKSLGGSILEAGQQVPIEVKRITDGQYAFELVDGERRFRACLICGIEYIFAYVVDMESDDDQFIASVVANFGSAEHTPLEVAFAIERMVGFFTKKKIEKTLAIEKVAKIFMRSRAWVYQYLGLLNLCKEVQDLMNKGKINFQTGVALCNFNSESQIRIASTISEKKLSHREALHYVRKNRIVGNLTNRAAIRAPSKDWEIIKTTVKRLRIDTDTTLDIKFPRLRQLLKERSKEEVQSIITVFKDAEENLRILREDISSIVESGG